MVSTYVRFFQALSDESRQKILLLLDKNSLSVGELAKLTKLSQPNTSRHLSVLKNAGLVETTRKGNRVIYSIDKEWFTKCCGEFFCNFNWLKLKRAKSTCK